MGGRKSSRPGPVGRPRGRRCRKTSAAPRLASPRRKEWRLESKDIRIVSSVSSPSQESCSQFLAGAVHADPHAGYGHAESLRDDFVGLSFDFPRQEDLSIEGRKLAERLTQQVGVLLSLFLRD